MHLQSYAYRDIFIYIYTHIDILYTYIEIKKIPTHTYIFFSSIYIHTIPPKITERFEAQWLITNKEWWTIMNHRFTLLIRPILIMIQHTYKGNICNLIDLFLAKASKRNGEPNGKSYIWKTFRKPVKVGRVGCCRLMAQGSVKFEDAFSRLYPMGSMKMV